ncbi:putative helicase MOV-10 [Belonocnema kinseyi]|uniref:putative helicase MOV-10 n=1 Tax=Belonocnema kinseyi TaxID=2817044 RepID=UPI00143CCA74|nr:putative helicase MOV-10 [Belonocnema kinseyi]
MDEFDFDDFDLDYGLNNLFDFDNGLDAELYSNDGLNYGLRVDDRLNRELDSDDGSNLEWDSDNELDFHNGWDEFLDFDDRFETENQLHPIIFRTIPRYSIPKELAEVLKENLKLYNGISDESLEYLSLLRDLPDVQYIKGTNYLEFLELLLHLEEYYSKESAVQIFRDKINRTESFLHSDRVDIRIPLKLLNKNLKDSLKPNNIIEVQELESPTKYNSVITEVGLKQNIVNVEATSSFVNIYQEESEYIVKLNISNWPIRVCHYAISLLDESKLSSLLNPTPRELCREPFPVLFWFNKNIKRNPEQMQAVQRILDQTARPSPYLVFGPPGTGKTVTIVEAISQITKNLKKTVLVCTPSNAAADEITKRLLPNIEQELICRLNSRSRDRRDIDTSIHCCSYSLLSRCMIWSKSVFITTLVGCTSYIFIDEAGQATQPETLIPLGLARLNDDANCAQLVLSGDPKQLGPVVKTKIGQHLLGESMLERMMNRVKLYQRDKNGKYNPNFLTKLVKNFRNHEAILRIPNQLFYENELVSFGGEEIFRSKNWSKLPNKKFPIIFHAVHGTEKKLVGSTSACNQLEVEIVVKYVSALLGERMGEREIEETDIGIVSPFKSQDMESKLATEVVGGVRVVRVRIWPFVYANDILLYAKSEKASKEMMKRLRRYLHKNRLFKYGTVRERRFRR